MSFLFGQVQGKIPRSMGLRSEGQSPREQPHKPTTAMCLCLFLNKWLLFSFYSRLVVFSFFYYQGNMVKLKFWPISKEASINCLQKLLHRIVIVNHRTKFSPIECN